jgi:RNA polymerase sigma factor (sigma-70 family)
MQQSDPTPANEARIREFHALYRGEFAFVWASARRLGVPAAALEDAVQDVFVTAYRRSEQLRFEVSARAWLYGVTRRVASRYHRGAFRMARRIAALSAHSEPPREAPQERLAQTERIDKLLARLGPRTRAAWEMADVLGMTGPEIASELGLPLNTVYSRVRLAREQLQAALRDPQELDRWLAETRRDDAPPESVAQRGWLLLLPTLGNSGTTAAGLGALATVRVAVTTVLVLAGVVVVARPRDEPPTPAPVTVEAAAPPVIAAAPPPSPSPTAAPEPVAPPPSPPRRARVAPSADRLAEEVALLDRVHARVTAGDAAAALALLDEHARRFADGALLDLGDAARVRALCLAGDEPAAVAVAARLVAAHPDSSVAQRHREFIKCPE